MQARKILKLVLEIVIVSVIAFFFAKTLSYYWSSLKESLFTINYYYLVLALLLSFVIYLLTTIGYNFILKKIGVKLRFRKVFRARVLSDMAAYIPGKIWVWLGRFYFLKDEPVKRGEILLSTAIEFALIGVSGIFVALISLFFWKENPFIQNSLLLIIPIIACPLLLHPKIFVVPTNFALKLIKRQQIIVNTRYIDLLQLFAFYIFYWAVHGLLLYILITSMTTLSIELLPIMVGIYSGAWIFAAVTFLTPAGLGMREGALAYLLSFFMPLPVGMIISILFRILIMISGAVLSIISWRM